MARSTVDKVNNPKLSAKGNRNGFDMSHRRLTTLQLGQLLPVLTIFGNPKDTYRLSCISQIRTIRPFVTTPFLRIREHLDYFAVPIRALWRGWENFITRQSNYSDALYPKEWSKDVPYKVPALQSESFAGWTPSTPLDELGFSVRSGMDRIASMLGFGLMTATDGENNPLINSQLVNFFAPLVYQKIYHHYYRNDKYEACDEESFNINDLGAGYDLNSADHDRIAKIFRIRYRWLKRDAFTSVSPDVIPRAGFIGYDGLTQLIGREGVYGRAASLSGLGVAGVQGASGDMDYANSVVSAVSGSTPPIQYNDGKDFQSPNYGAASQATPGSYVQISGNPSNVQDLKVAFASDRLLRRMYAAKNNYIDQMQSVFGVRPSRSIDDTCVHIGGYSNMLSSFETSSTIAGGSTTTENPNPNNVRLGSRVAQINNINKGKALKYKCSEHCIIMGVYSLSLENDYQSATRLDRHNMRLVYEDFPNPAFENLGRQPLSDYETGVNFEKNVQTGGLIGAPQVVGFVPRYVEDKLPIDIIDSGVTKFVNTRGYAAPLTDALYKLSPSPIPDDSHAYFISRLLTNPHLLDYSFGLNADGTYATDQFVTNFWFEVKKVANLSYLGETL